MLINLISFLLLPIYTLIIPYCTNFLVPGDLEGFEVVSHFILFRLGEKKNFILILAVNILTNKFQLIFIENIFVLCAIVVKIYIESINL